MLTPSTGHSAGTEQSFYKGSNPYLHLAWDEEMGVFGPGEPSIRFPVRFIGYMEVGRVGESRTAAVEYGAIVAMTYGHKASHTADAGHDSWTSLPPGDRADPGDLRRSDGPDLCQRAPPRRGGPGRIGCARAG